MLVLQSESDDKGSAGGRGAGGRGQKGCCQILRFVLVLAALLVCSADEEEMRGVKRMSEGTVFVSTFFFSQEWILALFSFVISLTIDIYVCLSILPFFNRLAVTMIPMI